MLSLLQICSRRFSSIAGLQCAVGQSRRECYYYSMPSPYRQPNFAGACILCIVGQPQKKGGELPQGGDRLSRLPPEETDQFGQNIVGTPNKSLSHQSIQVLTCGSISTRSQVGLTNAKLTPCSKKSERFYFRNNAHNEVFLISLGS